MFTSGGSLTGFLTVGESQSVFGFQEGTSGAWTLSDDALSGANLVRGTVSTTVGDSSITGHVSLEGLIAPGEIGFAQVYGDLFVEFEILAPTQYAFSGLLFVDPPDNQAVGSSISFHVVGPGIFSGIIGFNGGLIALPIDPVGTFQLPGRYQILALMDTGGALPFGVGFPPTLPSHGRVEATFSLELTQVPEPTSLLSLGGGLLGC